MDRCGLIRTVGTLSCSRRRSESLAFHGETWFELIARLRVDEENARKGERAPSSRLSSRQGRNRQRARGIGESAIGGRAVRETTTVCFLNIG